MKLNQQEKMFLNDLRTQEEMCVEKYKFYSGEAKDAELKQLFRTIQKQEKAHYDALGEMLEGRTPQLSRSAGSEDYQPKATYKATDTPAKKHDCFLCTDSITTEKYVSSAYNNDLFRFASPDIRATLNDIQTDEQNHAELIYKYKTVNSMT